jgi:uncharacterized membrane protein YkvA (DUF1232 family)
MKRSSVTLWFAYRHPDTPLLAKVICVVVVAYALSPIDLIPDFIPVLGYLDDALLLPALIWLAVRLIPNPVMESCREKADRWMEEQGRKPTSYGGAILVVVIWIAIAAGAWCWYESWSG